MTSSIFSSYLSHFCEVVKERPLSYCWMAILVIEKAKAEKVAIMKLPPHTTDELQSLDKCCFKLFKDTWNAELIQWQRSNQRTLSKSEFVDLVCKISPDALKSKNLVSGFSNTGICTFDRSKYPADQLDPDKLRRYNTQKNTNLQQDKILSGTVASVVQNHNISGGDSMPPCSEEVEACHSGSSNTSPRPTSVYSKESIASFEGLLLERIKRTEKHVAKRSWVDTMSQVITSDDYGKLIGEKQKLQKKEVGKQNKKTLTMSKSDKSRVKLNRKKAEETDSETDNISLESDDSLEDVAPFLECTPDPVTLIDPKDVVAGDYVLVKFQGGKRNSYCYRYVCTAQKVLENDLQVMAL